MDRMDRTKAKKRSQFRMMAMNRSTISLLYERGVSYTNFVSFADFQVSAAPTPSAKLSS